jgi:restriction system protein
MPKQLEEQAKQAGELSKSRALGTELLYAALSILQENGGEMPFKQLAEKVEARVALDDWATTFYESGRLRWQSVLNFFSVRAVKAGFLIKNQGLWLLTPEGENALSLGKQGLLNASREAYKKWNAQRGLLTVEENTEVDNFEKAELTQDEIEQKAMEGIEAFINSKNAYEFQDLCAALLRGMGYYTPFVAPRGKDGGVDIVAYRDPLGTVSPRIKVQVKHRSAATSVQEVRQLIGLLGMDGDVGIFISTGGFTPDAKTTARSSHVHVELITMNRLISLWQDFYPKMTDEDKNMLPLTTVYFLSSKS